MILFHEQAPPCVLKFALRERVSGASSLVCTVWGTYPGACFGSVFQEQAPSCVLVGVLTRERVSDACFRSKLPRVYRPLCGRVYLILCFALSILQFQNGCSFHTEIRYVQLHFTEMLFNTCSRRKIKY